MSRVDRVARNTKVGLISQIAIILSNFIVRKVFVTMLGEEYLGLGGLFTDILSMLSLAEMGFGSAIVFSLYKPLAQNDHEKIKSLMDLYKKAYYVIGAFVLIAGAALTPFLDFFVKEMPEHIEHIGLIYLLNVLNAGASYFFIYKASLLFADEKKYVEMMISVRAKLICAAGQVLVLWLTHNYFLYMGVMVAATIMQNVMISVQVDRMYPYLKEKHLQPLPAEDTAVIRRNVGAMVFHKIGSVAVFGTDSILLAKFVSVAVVGLYSNYTLIRKALLNVIDMLYVSIAASMGNLNASETDDKKYEAYQHIHFFSAWLFGFVCVCLLGLYNPFIELWLGRAYLLPFSTVFLIVVNFYMSCMRIPVSKTKEAMGLFWNDRYKPIFEVAINLVVSIVLAGPMGINGIFIGTLVSTLTVPFIVEPYVLYRHGLKRSVLLYYRDYMLYLTVTAAAAAATLWLCSLTGAGLLSFVVKMAICSVVPNLVYLLAYHRTEDFHYLLSVARRLAGRFLKKLGAK